MEKHHFHKHTSHAGAVARQVWGPRERYVTEPIYILR